MSKKKLWLTVGTGILSILLFVSVLLPVYGSGLEDLKKEQKQIQQGIEKDRRNIKEADKKIVDLGEQVEYLERETLGVSRDLQVLEVRLKEAEVKVREAEEKLRKTEADLEERTGIFRTRIKDIYESGEVSYLEVLLQATDMTDFLVRMELLRKIAEQDVCLLEEIEEKRSRIAALKSELETNRNKIASMKAETAQKKERLQNQQRQKEEILVKIKADKEAARRALAEKEAVSKRLAERIRKFQMQASRNSQSSGGNQNGPSSGKQFTGSQAWPAPGNSRITSDYGMRMHPILKTSRMHTGVDIAAPSGSQVVSTGAGAVIFAGWLGAYGQTVVIDHGGGISTLYAHLSSIQVREGQSVSLGQKIGGVGSTGFSTGPHLHFEVRQNGEPVNPWPYLK